MGSNDLPTFYTLNDMCYKYVMFGRGNHIYCRGRETEPVANKSLHDGKQARLKCMSSGGTLSLGKKKYKEPDEWLFRAKSRLHPRNQSYKQGLLLFG